MDRDIEPVIDVTLVVLRRAEPLRSGRSRFSSDGNLRTLSMRHQAGRYWSDACDG